MAEDPLARLNSSPVILVVEDEDEVRKVVCLTLELQGFRVITAANAEQALALVRNERMKIDLLLTDVVMPRLSGPELAAQIREIVPQLKVLYISGYAEDSLQSHGLSTVGDNFLAKPFSSAALGAKVREVMH